MHIHQMHIHSTFFLLKDPVPATPGDTHQDCVISTAEQGVTHVLVLFCFHTQVKHQQEKKGVCSFEMWNFLVRVLGIPLRYHGV